MKIEYINAPMPENDAGAKTIKDYFRKLLLTLWEELEDFSGKRPFGNSGWAYDVYAALIKCGAIEGELYSDSYVIDIKNFQEADKMVVDIINDIFDMGTADVKREND